MKTIFKTWKKATYFEGHFSLRNETDNWATSINFPTVFVAYSQGIRSGNWQSCTSINTPNYVINHYFNGIGNNRNHLMYHLWSICKQLELIKWVDVKEDKENVLNLINLANNELLKLKTL